jgi:hypothetical protein
MAGYSIINSELKESACQRMAQVLDDHSLYVHVCACMCRYLACICVYVHVSCFARHALTVTSWYQDLAGKKGPLKRRQTVCTNKYPSSSDDEDFLTVSRYWDSNEDKKTGGCIVDGLSCCIWASAQASGKASLDLVKGWTNMCREAPQGNLGLTVEDLAWHAGSGLPEPTLFSRLPLLHFLSHKIVHFVVDYRPDWITSLQLPPSDGTHRQLRSEHFQPALLRLQNMPDTDTPLQLFSSVNIYLKEWRGSQTVHATPFKQSTPCKVVYCMCMYVYVCACM